MSQRAGWYDDPEDRDKLRYWDGVQWTDHLAPKRKPNLERAGQQDQGRDADEQTSAASAAQGYGQHGWGGHETHHGAGHSGAGQPGGQGGYAPYTGQQPPSQGQWQGQPMPGAYPQQQGPTTPDGMPLAGWWHRAGARLIDGALALVLWTALLWLTADQEVLDAMNDYLISSTEAAPTLPVVLQDWVFRAVLIFGAAGMLYEVLMVKLLGGTLGKLATGLRVRLRDEPGHPPWGSSVLRWLIFQGPGIIANLRPVLGFLVFFPLINVLWPLWDPQRQALHDKAARTNVVRVR